jgi:glutathionylspermidine synthase
MEKVRERIGVNLMTLLWSVYGNHHTTCACGFSAEVIESNRYCTWTVYVKRGVFLEEGSAHSLKEAKAMAEASLMGYIYEAEGIV